jgi:hypothetical protein
MTSGFLSGLKGRIAAFYPSPRKALLLAFIFGFGVRLIPELLSYPHPIGFDTIYYGWMLKEGVVWTHWSGVFSSWLFYGLTIPLYNIVLGDPFLFLKGVMPVLFGLTSSGVHYLATRGLGWSTRKGLFAAAVFSLQVAALGISWHFYRNVLGLALLLFAIPWIMKDRLSFKSAVVFCGLAVLVVFSHEYSAVLLLTSVFVLVASHLLKGRAREAVKGLGVAVPACTLFLATVFLRVYPFVQASDSNVLMAFQSEGHYSGPLFFMTDYLNVADTVQHYPTYLDLAASVLSLFIVMYVAILPLAVVGFFRDRVLDVWLVLFCIGAFGCLALPFFALDYWNRWMLMLVFPLTYYAANGFVRVLRTNKPLMASIWRLGSFRVSRKAAKGMLSISLISGLIFMSSPMFWGVTGVFCLPTTVVYMPTTMQCNAVPLCDVDETVNVLRWVNSEMDGDLCFLTHDAFYYWTQLSINEELPIIFFKNDVLDAVDLANEHGYNHFWLLWWNVDIGWYGFTVPDSFREIYSSGRISIFEYHS